MRWVGVLMLALSPVAQEVVTMEEPVDQVCDVVWLLPQEEIANKIQETMQERIKDEKFEDDGEVLEWNIRVEPVTQYAVRFQTIQAVSPTYRKLLSAFLNNQAQQIAEEIRNENISSTPRPAIAPPDGVRSDTAGEGG